MPWEGGTVPREPWQHPGKEAPCPGSSRPCPENGGIVALNLPRFRLHPYAAIGRRSPSGRLARSNSSGLRYPSAEWIRLRL